MKRTILAIALCVLSGVAAAKNECGNNGNNCDPVTTGTAGGSATQGQGQAQGQLQGQAQGQSATGIGIGTGGTGYGVGYGGSAGASAYAGSTAYGSSSYNVNTPTATGGKVENSGNSTATGGSSRQSQEQANVGNNTGTSNVTVQGDQAQARNPVSSALGPTIVTGPTQCLVPVSAGAQGIGFGLSFGSAVRDEVCEAIQLSRQLLALGFRDEAVRLLRATDPRVDAAFQK